jgi:hypothetical protein
MTCFPDFELESVSLEEIGGSFSDAPGAGGFIEKLVEVSEESGIPSNKLSDLILGAEEPASRGKKV